MFAVMEMLDWMDLMSLKDVWKFVWEECGGDGAILGGE